MTNERIFQIADKHLQLYKQHKGKRPDDAWLLSHIAGAVDEAVKEVNKIIVKPVLAEVRVSMEDDTKKEIKRLRLQLLKNIWHLIGIVLFLLIAGTTFIKYYWMGEQPSNFTTLVIILIAISLNEKGK